MMGGQSPRKLFVSIQKLRMGKAFAAIGIDALCLHERILHLIRTTNLERVG